jgi:tetratricopeptide (TPR) repeat protein
MVEEVGLSPMEAIVAGTRLSAEFLGLSDSLGTIAPGKIADLVLLDADPLADIVNTARIAAVVQQGRLLDGAAIDRLRDEALHDPAIDENDWLPPPPSPELVELQAILQSIDEADLPEALAETLASFDAYEGAARMPGGAAAVDARIESAVNRAGYRQMRADAIEAAVEIFALNTRRFPDSANVWDSLAEAYMERGDRERAIQHYRRSLELDPNNDNARERLEALGAPATDSPR